MSTTNGNKNLYKTGTVSRITGFSPTLLRAWERRYGFLEPERLPGGHRLYTEEDLKVLERVKELLDQGFTVGRAGMIGREGLLEALEDAQQEMSSQLEVYREERYTGDGLGVSIRELDSNDLTTICRLYELVKRTYELWIYMDGVKNEELVITRLERLTEPDLVSAVAQLGHQLKDSDSVLLKAAIEDARWGALGPLLSKIRSVEGAWTTDHIKAAVLLARDHAKMMRNAFYDLDVPLREADTTLKAHGAAPFAKKLDGLDWDGQKIEAMLSWDGALTSRCLETSLIDRILYDFLRRAHRGGSESVHLELAQVNSQLVRFSFRADTTEYSAPTSEDFVALAVARAVGLTASAALQMGYLGVNRNPAGTVAWFHWPLLEVPPGTEICSCEFG